MQMLVKDIVKACNGVLLCGDPETVITSVETDSRLIEPGFVCTDYRSKNRCAPIYSANI